MAEINIDQKLKEAFAKTVPDFPEAVLEQCSERKGAMTVMKEHKKAGKSLRIALAAAALVVALAVTVTAASLSNVIAPAEALHMAMTHAVRSETDPELKSELDSAISGGLAYDEDFGTGEADLGLKSGRIVYNISFKTCGYSYDIVMDAKTGIVLSLERSADGNWEEALP